MFSKCWVFSQEEMKNTPSRKYGVSQDQELAMRQDTAAFILILGRQLKLKPTCIRTAMVFMHRFYMFHSFKDILQTAVSTTCIALACKTEKRSENLTAVDIIHCLDYCLLGPKYSPYEFEQLVSELTINENSFMEILEYDLIVIQPHMIIVGTVKHIEESERLTKASYFMASYSIRKTTICLQYPPTVAACICIYAASIIEHLEIPRSKNGEHWFTIIEKSIKLEEVEEITKEFMPVLNNYHPTLKDLEQPEEILLLLSL